MSATPDYTAMSSGEMVTRCGDSAEKWAAAFWQHARKHGLPDEHGMLGWFANAIEAACDKRAGRVLNGDHAQFLVDRALGWRSADL